MAPEDSATAAALSIAAARRFLPFGVGWQSLAHSQQRQDLVFMAFQTAEVLALAF